MRPEGHKVPEMGKRRTVIEERAHTIPRWYGIGKPSISISIHNSRLCSWSPCSLDAEVRATGPGGRGRSKVDQCGGAAQGRAVVASHRKHDPRDDLGDP